jgi:hypothetical protein
MYPGCSGLPSRDAAIVAAVSPRTRILALIGVVAVVVVAAVVLVAAGGDGGSDNGRSAARKGLPPLALDLGLRADAQAEALRRAVTLYNVRKQAPAAGRIHENVWWAKMMAAGLPKLTNEWHWLMQKAKLGSEVERPGLGLPDWEMEATDRIWRVVELRNNRELINEGRKQKHCVYSYVPSCLSGRSAILSLRAFRKVATGCTEDGRKTWGGFTELGRATLEVSPSQQAIVQARGPLNGPLTDDERTALRQWAGETGLRLRVQE